MRVGFITAKEMQARSRKSLSPKDYLPFAWEQHDGWCILEFRNNATLSIVRLGHSTDFKAILRRKSMQLFWSHKARNFKEAQRKALNKLAEIFEPIVEYNKQEEKKL